MTSKIATCLWVDGGAEEAARFYTSLVPGSELGPVFRQEDGSAFLVCFTLAGVPYQLLNGGPRFQLDEAASIVVDTSDQAETDRYWDALTSDGGAESRCGWCRDRFGLSWQIVPQQLLTALSSEDREAAGRAIQAMSTMTGCQQISVGV